MCPVFMRTDFLTLRAARQRRHPAGQRARRRHFQNERNIFMKLKHLLWYFAGSVAVLGCWTLARAVTQLLTGAAVGVQVFYPVLLSPLVSLPLGIFGALLGHMAEKIRQKDLSASARFVVGSLPIVLLLVVDFVVRASALLHR